MVKSIAGRNILLATLLLSTACGGDKAGGGATLGGGGGGGGGDSNGMDAGASGLDGGADGGSAGDGGSGSTVSEMGPIIEIKTPKKAVDPVKDEVLVGKSVEVTCAIKQREGGAPFDPTSVLISLYEPDETKPLASEPGVSKGVGLFGATLPLDDMPTGPVRIECSASDTGKPAQTGTATLTTLYDGGPKVSFVNLANGGVVARGQDTAPDVAVQIKVEPAPLADGDTEAAVATTQFMLNKKPFQAILDQKTNTYTYQIDFTTLFNGAPVSSITLDAAATNKRSPKAATATQSITVAVDGQGPKVTIDKPKASSIVGGLVKVEVSITDDLAGVAVGNDKLYAKLGDQPETYPLSEIGKGKYGFSFQAASITNSADVSIAVYAEDKAGNSSVSSVLVRLDLAPPWVSLTPPNVRELSTTTKVDGMNSCSGTFDPNGGAPVDGQIIQASITYPRVLIWENGTREPGSAQVWIAGVDNPTATLYAQDDPTVPLLIDGSPNDGSTDCTMVNAVPAGKKEPVPVALAPIASGGKLPYGENTDGDEPPFPPNPDDGSPMCAGTKLPVSGDGTIAPKCSDSDMSYVLKHTMTGTPSVIYGVTPTASGVGCTGTSWNPGYASGGWMCLVAAAFDKAGNLGFSNPVRVCREVTGSDCPEGLPGDIATPPDTLTCTDGCSIPDQVIEPQMPVVIVR